jgi:hypothetical protein
LRQMSSQNNPEVELILCARCAWREFCVKKFTLDNTKPIKCPDFSLDINLIKKEKEGDQKGDKGDPKGGS